MSVWPTTAPCKAFGIGSLNGCALTGVALVPGDGASLDHIVPRSRGGTSAPSNLRWVTTDANTAKGALSDAEFLVMCCAVVATLGAKEQ